MSIHDKPDHEVSGQLSIENIYAPPDRLVAVSRIFARARKEMSLNEQKTFVYALSQINFKKPAESEYVRLDKKVLAQILGISSDPDHLSQNLYDEIKNIWIHSHIKIADRDLDLYSDGAFISSVTKFKNILRIHFNGEYLGLFTNLDDDYITMWSSDIFRMTTKRSVQFYEYLRQITADPEKKAVNDVLLGIKALKEMFEIPENGPGSYMREKSGFNRYEFEKKVIDPLCEDLQKCQMLSLVLQPDGKPYEKVKRAGKVYGYRFYWTFTEHPAVATAAEMKELREIAGPEVGKDPKVLKVAKDIVAGEKKPKAKKQANSFHNFTERETDYQDLIDAFYEGDAESEVKEEPKAREKKLSDIEEMDRRLGILGTLPGQFRIDLEGNITEENL